ncbi:MAG: aldo/keto reductase [Clostridia bacterium]|nr:aldo/keto reductase [Clostridia bacterium]
MLYRKMEKTGDELSILGFGGMRFPEKNGEIDKEKSLKLIYSAIEKGINYFDTALPYHFGQSESLLGEALSNGYRDKVKIATKMTPWLVKEPSDMEKLFQIQLRNLQTNFIDYYLVHTLDKYSWDKMKKMGVTDFLNKCKKEGRIRNAGFSFHGDKETFKVIVDEYEWDFCQIQYNILDENTQAGKEGLEYASAKGLGIIIMEPLRGGILAGKLPAQVEKIYNENSVKRLGVEWALRWLWNHKEISVVLSSMNEEAFIEENTRIASEAYADSLTTEELKLLDRAKESYKKLMKINCTGCRYCMPCPANVNIPACFQEFNLRYLFGQSKLDTRVKYMLYCGNLNEGTPQFASQCIGCGKCETKCPQKLPIRKLLKDISKELEGIAFKLFYRMAKFQVGRMRKKTIYNKKITY